MCGAGKSEVARYMMEKRQFGYFRFGQITLDKIIEIGEKPTEALEKKFREEFRKEYGMAAFVILNKPKINKLMNEGDVIGDNLISWEEYIELKKEYSDNLIIICVWAPPKVRYARLEGRAENHGEDKNLRYRSFTKVEAASRDVSEIENLHKAGPIAMADFIVINVTDVNEIEKQVDVILESIYAKNMV